LGLGRASRTSLTKFFFRPLREPLRKHAFFIDYEVAGIMGCFQFCENNLRCFLYGKAMAGNFVVLQGSDNPAVAAAAPNQNARVNVVCLGKTMSAFYSMKI